MNKFQKNGFGCIELIFWLTLIFILSAIAIPAFWDTRVKNVDQLKNALYQGIRECSQRKLAGKTILFNDIKIFSAWPKPYTIKPLDKNSCFKARGIVAIGSETWFEINYDPLTKEFFKTCGDVKEEDCQEGNTW